MIVRGPEDLRDVGVQFVADGALPTARDNGDVLVNGIDQCIDQTGATVTGYVWLNGWQEIWQADQSSQATLAASLGPVAALTDLAVDYYAIVLADSPIHYWPLDETSGTVATDLVGARDGTYSGGVTLGATGLVAGSTAVEFDGVDGTVELGSTTTADDISGIPTDALTWEFWLRRDAVANIQRLVNRASNGNTLGGYSIGVYTSGEIWVNVDSGTDAGINIPVNLALATTYHLAVTIDNSGATAAIAVYVDGALADTGNCSRDLGEATVDMFLSGGPGSNTDWDGALQHIAVYDYVLSPTQIADHHAAGS